MFPLLTLAEAPNSRERAPGALTRVDLLEHELRLDIVQHEKLDLLWCDDGPIQVEELVI
jgi:hypothetical protein